MLYVQLFMLFSLIFNHVSTLGLLEPILFPLTTVDYEHGHGTMCEQQQQPISLS